MKRHLFTGYRFGVKLLKNMTMVKNTPIKRSYLPNTKYTVMVCAVLFTIATTAQRWTPYDPENIAAFKPAKQSSQFGHGHANRAVDGNTDGHYHHHSITHTQNQENSWWEVNLLEEYDIKSITLYNRTDCCDDRLSNFSIIVADREGGNGTKFNNDGSFFRGSKKFTGNARGQFVRIQLDRQGILSLAEVVVNGTLVNKRRQSNDNLALGKPTRQRSTINNRPSNLANDGNLEGNVNLGSVATTNNESRPFWEVDLGRNYLIKDVVISKRTDGNQNGLKDFNIWVTQDIRNDNRNTEPFFAQKLHLEQNIQRFTGATKRPGRYVRVQMKGNGPLELGEVQVYGEEIGDLDISLPDQSRVVYTVSAYSNGTSSPITVTQEIAKNITEGFSFSKSTEETDNRYWEVSASVKASVSYLFANIEVTAGTNVGGSTTKKDVSSQASNFTESKNTIDTDVIPVQPNRTIYKVKKWKIVAKPFVYTANGKQYKFNRILDASTSLNDTKTLEYPFNFDPGFEFDSDNRISDANFKKIMDNYQSERLGSTAQTPTNSTPNQQPVVSNTNPENTSNATPNTVGEEVEYDVLKFHESENITIGQARQLAQQNGWQLATAGEIEDEWQYNDLHIEKCGLIEDGRIAAPVQRETDMLYRGANIGLDTDIVHGFFYYEN